MYYFNTQYLGGKFMLQMVNMKYPKQLLDRIDKFQKDSGFTTRTNAIIHLILLALESKGY